MREGQGPAGFLEKQKEPGWPLLRLHRVCEAEKGKESRVPAVRGLYKEREVCTVSCRVWNEVVQFLQEVEAL